jgi:hypothetical protein
MQLIRNHATLYRYDYTLIMIARQGNNYDVAYTFRLAQRVGVPELYFMSPNPNTD